MVIGAFGGVDGAEDQVTGVGGAEGGGQGEAVANFADQDRIRS